MWPVRPTHRSLPAAQMSILPSHFLAHVELLSASLARFIAVVLVVSHLPHNGLSSFLLHTGMVPRE